MLDYMYTITVLHYLSGKGVKAECFFIYGSPHLSLGGDEGASHAAIGPLCAPSSRRARGVAKKHWGFTSGCLATLCGPALPAPC